MNELRLLFGRSGDALTYRIATSWGGDAGEAQPFEPFLSDEDYDDLRWYLEEYMELPLGGAKIRAARVERAMGEWGKKLFSLVFGSGDHRELYASLVEGEAPRLLTIGTKDLDVLRLPWEMMADGKGPLTRRGVTIRRQLESARARDRYEAGRLPLRILLAVSRPDDAGFLDPRHTTRAMLDALAPLGDGVVVDFCRPATLDVLERMLTKAEREGRAYHIVHFNGHGTFLSNSQIGALCFEKEEDTAGEVHVDTVRADRIGELLAAHKIPLAILEACQTAQLSRIAAFRGVAPALIEAGVGSVLSMSHAVHVEATRILLERFYEDLVAGATIGQALEQGRAALMSKADRWIERGPGGKSVALKDWFLPNLYQRGEDLVLVPGGAEKAPRSETAPAVRREPATGSELGAFPGKPMYGFVGRARELHQIERRFLKHRAVLLHAMGGMGKTALAREAAFWWAKPAGLFPDGACFVSFEQAGGARRAVQALGAYFDGAAFEQRSAEEQEKRARELFQQKKVLVVWDNFESVLPAFQERAGLELYPEEERAAIAKLFTDWTADERGAGRLLVTCRPGTTGLGGMCKVEIEGLARPDALSLLHAVMQRAGVTRKHPREELIDLVETLERHPLSIELVGPHLVDTAVAEIQAGFGEMLDRFKGEAAEGRNRSLRASLEFSLGRLSPEAGEAVKWLGLFRGGVFENVLLAVSEMDPAAWEKTRSKMEATALLRLDREVEFGGRPFLQFHPTLAHAVDAGEPAAAVRERFVDVYLAAQGEIHKTLRGPNPQWGMTAVLREEENLRRAIEWALEAKSYGSASAMGDTLSEYLQRAGRLRERDRWVMWLASEVRKGGFTDVAVEREIEAAWVLLSQGTSNEAIEKLEALIARLERTTEFDAALSLARASQRLGRTYCAIGWAHKAIPVLQDTVVRWEGLFGKARAVGKSGEAEQANLSATLCDLAHALRHAGRLDEAMTAIERASNIYRETGRDRDIAAGLAISAKILTKQGYLAEANARNDDAIEIARRAGDREMEAALLQAQGGLADEMGLYDRAAKLHQQALQLFQEMNAEEGVMLSCNLLGVVEQHAGRLAEARGWYERAREIALRRKDQRAVGNAAQNLGIVRQLEAEAARERGNETGAWEHLTEAAELIRVGLSIRVKNQDEPRMADSHSQLAQIALLLGDLSSAEEHAHRAREIYEHLGLKEAWRAYKTLADIARARGNLADATAWEQKRGALVAELHRRAGGPALPQKAIQGIAQLAVACAQVGLTGEKLDAGAEEAIATIAKWPAPLDALAPFLRTVAAGGAVAVPTGLPKELSDALGQVVEALRKATGGE